MPIQQGMNQQTPAAQNVIRSVLGKGVRAVKRAAKSAVKRTVKRAAKRAAGKIKFGSPAWQKKYKIGKYAKK